MRIRRGSLYVVDFNPRARTKPGEVRPAVVVQVDLLNHAQYPSTALLPTTTRLVAMEALLRLRLPAACEAAIDIDAKTSPWRRSLCMAFTEIGVVHGSTITLDAPVPPLEGKRVRVLLEVIDGEEVALSAAAQERLWREWIAHGPQGPIEDDNSWPDEK